MGRAIGFFIVLVLVLIYVVFIKKEPANNHNNNPEQVFCTMEAKECPDGSYVGRSGPNCEFAPCPSFIKPATWRDLTDAQQKIVFSYPIDLGQKYISPEEWPPKLSVSQADFVCQATAETSSQASRVSERQINGQTYCISAESEGAAGTTYTSYIYTTQRAGRLISLAFTLRYPQCLNYDNPEQTACIDERQNFDIDGLLDQMMSSVRDL